MGLRKISYSLWENFTEDQINLNLHSMLSLHTGRQE